MKFAFRRLRRSPGFTIFAVVTLALAIGVTTAVYSLLAHGLRPELGLDHPDRLAIAAVNTSLTGVPAATTISSLDWADVAVQNSSFSHVAVWSPFTTALVVGETSEFATGELVSGNFFDTIELRAVRGRLLDDGDDRPGAPPVAVMSESTWRRRFSHRADAVGSTIKLAGHQFAVVGIVPETFRGVRPRGGFERVEAWVPLAQAPVFASRFSRQNPARRADRWLSLVASIAPGRTVADAGADLGRIGDRIDRVEPLPPMRLTGGSQYVPPRKWTAMTADDRVGFSEARDVFRVVLLLPMLVLIVACTNLANFALSRGVARHHELAVREAMGASRWELMGDQVAEYVLIAAFGALGGLIVAGVLLSTVAGFLRSIGGNMPQFRIDSGIDSITLVSAALFAMGAVIIAGILPAIRLTGRGLARAIASEQGSTPLPRWRGRSNLIALQLAVSVALLLVSALCVRQLPKIQAQAASGMALDRVGVVSVPFAAQSADEARTRRTLERIGTELGNVRAIDAWAYGSGKRFSELVKTSLPDRSIPPDGRNAPTARLRSVSAGYFKTLGVPLVTGRSFDDRDRVGGEPVAIINASKARERFGTTDALGRQLSYESQSSPGQIRTLTIVGVAGDTRSGQGDGSVDDTVYVPFDQRYEEVVPIDIVARAADSSDAGRAAELIRDAVHRADAEVAVGFVGRADAVEGGPAMALRYFAIAFGSLAFLALGFATSGLYGVLSHIVASRTRELGVRAALGADRTRLIRLVFKDGSRPVIEGIVIGFGLAAGARLGMQPWFTDPVTAIDPVALIIALVPLVIAAGLACYFPARRAASVDPNVALRHL